MADKNLDFAFETTLSGKSYSSFLTELKKKDRVAAGGHDVPAVDVIDNETFEKIIKQRGNI